MHGASSAKRLAFNSIAVAVGLLLALAAAEALLRLSGHRPWRYWTEALEIHEPDEQLGWKPRVGRHDLPPYKAGEPRTVLTILPDGSRSTGAHPASDKRKLAFAGCSITQGWAITDSDTFAWKIQQRLPDLDVVNFGTGAYGTYQSLLVLERVFAGPDTPDVVYYGLIEEHEVRNVAAMPWLLLLALRSRTDVAVPYCTLDDAGNLIRHPPEAYPSWPLRGWLATVAFLEQQYLRFVTRDRDKQATRVTEQLILEMRNLVERKGRFRVVLLRASPPARRRYLQFFQQNGVDFADCALPMPPSMRVPGDYHPNGAMNTRYADCLAPYVRIDLAPE
jgi:hypothetical protein